MSAHLARLGIQHHNHAACVEHLRDAERSLTRACGMAIDPRNHPLRPALESVRLELRRC